MSEETVVTTLFKKIDELALNIQKQDQQTYLEAIVAAGEDLFASLESDKYTKENLRKAVQLAVLNGMKEAVQPHHEMTPDAVAMFIGYLVQKWTEHKVKDSISLLDPVIGTGNLLTAVMNRLPQDLHVRAFGVEADETLLKLAYMNANLQAHEIELFHGDAVKPLFIDPVDIVVADLPVGYYPNDDVAANFSLREKSGGHSLIHELLIEQSVKYAKAGAVLVLLVPNILFEQNSIKKLNHWLQDHAVIQGVLQLPLSLFKQEKHAKSILMLQKKGEAVASPKRALIAELPNFTDQQAVAHVIAQIDEWFQQKVRD